AQERRRADRHRDRHRHRAVDRRRRGHRDRVRDPGRRPAHGRRHPAPRLSGHSRHRAAVQLHLRPRQPDDRPAVHRALSEDPLLSAGPTATALDPVAEAAAAYGVGAAPDLADILPPVKVRRGLVGFAWRHPAIAIGGALVLAMLLIALLAPWLGTVDPTALAPARRTREPSAAFW